jgi:hypothetical protein
MEPADHRDPDQVCRLKDDTDLWLTEDGRKGMGRDLRVLPKTLIHDPGCHVNCRPACRS